MIIYIQVICYALLCNLGGLFEIFIDKAPIKYTKATKKNATIYEEDISYRTPAPSGPIIANIAVTGLPTLCIEAIYLRPKYLDHKNSLTGIVDPNPNPYKKNPMIRKIGCSV